jgi:hypothetical protein
VRALLLLGFGVVLLIPNWLVLPPDDENLSKEILSTVFQSREIFSGRYPFWDPWVAFGVPQPPSQTLVFHPFVVLVELLPLGVAIGALYQLQVWIGVLSVWAVARHFGIRRPIAGLCVLTYALCSMMIVYLTNFWPVNLVDWTLAPLLLLLLLKLLDTGNRSARVTYAIGTGLCAAFMVLDGHAASLVDYGLPFLAFLAGRSRRVRQLWPWLAASLAVAVVAAASQVYGIALESSRAVTARNNQVTVAMNFWRLIMYPITSPFHEGNSYRALAIGGPFFLLTAVGLAYPLRHRYVNGLRAGVVVSFALWFIPVRWTAIRGGNFFSAAPFTIFAIFLAGLALQALWKRLPSWRPALATAVLLQVVALTAGYYPYYRSGVSEAATYLSGSPSSNSLKQALKNQPIYASFERQPGINRTRVYLAPGADARLFRKATDYKFEGWSLHNLRLVNGLFKGVDMHEIAPAHVYLRGEIRGDARVSRSQLTLDELNIGYVLATPADPIAPSLTRITTFHLDRPRATIIAYRNPGAWPDAVALEPRAKQIGLLPRRTGCSSPGLLCANFASVASLRLPVGVRSQDWVGTDLSVKLARVARPRVLMITQLYRPGWEAKLSNGRTVPGYRLFGGFTGFDLPPSVDSARISYHPTLRIALTILTWATVILGLLTMAGIPLARRMQTNGSMQPRTQLLRRRRPRRAGRGST